MPTRDELEAQLREAEEKRDRLQARLEQERLAPRSRPEGHAPVVAAPAAILEKLDKVMTVIQPQLDRLVSERENLIAECEAARQRNDAAGVSESTEMLAFLDTVLVEFSENAAKLSELAEGLRARIASEASSAGNGDAAG